MQDTLILSDWIIECVWLINMAGTLGQTYLCRLHSRRRDLRVVFLVSDIVDSGCRNCVLRVCWLSRRLAIETKQVSQILAELSSARYTSIRDSGACAFDWCSSTSCRLFWECLVWEDNTRFSNSFLIKLLERSWRMWWRCRWHNWRVYSAELSLSGFLLRNTLWFVRLSSLVKGGLWRYYFWD